MEDLLGAILAAIGEFLLEMLGELLLDLFARALGALLTSLLESVPFMTQIGVGLMGLASGAISIHFFPHPLVHPARIHGASLIISPVLSGVVMWMVGSFLRSRGKKTVAIENFACGFTFAFAMALIRFFFTHP